MNVYISFILCSTNDENNPRVFLIFFTHNKLNSPLRLRLKWFGPERIVAMPLDGPLDTQSTGWLDANGTSACFLAVSVTFSLCIYSSAELTLLQQM